jgi:hypothetical protein
MNGLFRFIAKLIGHSRSATPETPSSLEKLGLSVKSADRQARTSEPLAAVDLALEAPPQTSIISPQPSEPTVVLLDLADDEDVAEEPEDESDEPDPTLGRYEELHVEILVAEEIDAQRAAAEAEGLSGPHKIFPHDPAGPGSLAETLARLEAEGRVTSRVCDEAGSGFYVLYEPTATA